MPRLRSGVPVVRALRPLDGGRAGGARRPPPSDAPVAPARRRVARLPPRPPAPLASRRAVVAARTRAARSPRSGAPPCAADLAALPRPTAASTHARRDHRRVLVPGVRDGRVAARDAPGRASRHGGGGRAPRSPRPGSRLLRRAARACGTRRRSTEAREPCHQIDARRRAGRGRQCGMRRGHEGLRPSSRNSGGGGVRGPRPRFLGVARVAGSTAGPVHRPCRRRAGPVPPPTRAEGGRRGPSGAGAGVRHGRHG